MRKKFRHIIKKAKSMSLTQDEKMGMKKCLEHHIGKIRVIKKNNYPSLSKAGIKKKITKRNIKIVKKVSKQTKKKHGKKN